MNSFIAIGILSVLLFMRSQALDYGLLENLEVSCHPHDNCMLSHSSNFENRSCECDSQCNDFQDCCIDKAYLPPDVLRMTRPRACMAFGGQHQVGVYAIDSCPRNYTTSDEIQNLCQEDDFYDPVASTPLTVVATNTTYKNRYCAECNGASPATLKPWKLYLHCPTLKKLNLNESYIWQNLEYNTSEMTWGAKYDNVFHRCQLIYEKPQNLTAVRFCRANTIDTCPPSFLGIEVKKYCESYSAVVYDSENAYKNPHCAICNNGTLSDLLCWGSSLMNRNRKPFTFALLLDMNLGIGDTCPSGQKYDPFFKKCRPASCVLMNRKKKLFTFAHLLDVNTGNGDCVGMVDEGNTCPSGQKYDTFFKKCRPLSCALPGFTVVEGKCKKADDR